MLEPLIKSLFERLIKQTFEKYRLGVPIVVEENTKPIKKEEGDKKRKPEPGKEQRRRSQEHGLGKQSADPWV